jgi:hypothetical protein
LSFVAYRDAPEKILLTEVANLCGMLLWFDARDLFTTTAQN